MATLDDLVVELHLVADQFNRALQESQAGVEAFARVAEERLATVEERGRSLGAALSEELGRLSAAAAPDPAAAIATFAGTPRVIAGFDTGAQALALPDPGALRELGAELQRSGAIARQLGLTMASAFEAAIVKGGDLRDVLRGLAADVLQILARKLVTEPLAGFIAGSLGVFGLPGFAQGGLVPPGLPELPGGGVLARVHAGELILTPAQQTALLAGRSGPTINLTVQAAPGGTTADARRTGRQILGILRDQMAGLAARGT
jgi:hypothetical protein